jgi:hypothetical protein
MTSYEIQRWDVVMNGSDSNKSPMIYIIPDPYFLEFARVNEFSLFCEIIGTNSGYDGHVIEATVNKSVYSPNFRPNFFESTQAYVVTLNTHWNGYPILMGNIRFFGYKEPKVQMK